MVSVSTFQNICLDEFERKGVLYKKSLNSDKFKERILMLEGCNLFYYKSERTSKCQGHNLLFRTEELCDHRAEQVNDPNVGLRYARLVRAKASSARLPKSQIEAYSRDHEWDPEVCFAS